MIRTLFILVAAIFTVARAGGNTPADSVRVPFPDTYQFQALTLGTPLIAGGLAVKSSEDKFSSRLQQPFAVKDRWYDNCMQYTPAATMLALKLAGVEGRSSWKEMLTADATATMVMCGTVQLLKNIDSTLRPDHSDDHSFPSGHTAVAFMTATMLHHEYGSRYPWLSVAGYGMATATALVRVEHDKHWVGDVMVGAGIGVLSTEIGYMMSDLIFHRPVMGRSASDFPIEHNPSFLGVYMGLNVPTGSHSLTQGLSFKTASGTTIGLEGAWFFSNHFGAGGRITVSNERFYVNDNIPQSMPRKYGTAMAGVYYSVDMSRRLSVGAKATAGYCRYSSVDINWGEDDELNIPSRGGAAFGTGLSLTARMQPHLGYRLFCDLDILPAQEHEGHRLTTALSIGAQVMFDF